MRQSSKNLAQTIQLRSAVQGRQRWDIGEFLQCLALPTNKREALLNTIAQSTRAQAGVYSVVVNPVTARVLITFNPEVFSLSLPSFWVAQTLAKVPPRDLAPIQSPWRLLQFANMAGIPLAKPLLYSILSALAAPAAFISIGLALSVAMSKNLPFLTRMGVVGAVPQVGVLAAAYLSLSTLNNFLQHQSQVAWSRAANKTESALRNRLAGHVHDLDMAYLDKQSSGELLNLIVDDTAKMKHFVEIVPHSAIKKVLGLAAAGSVLWYLSPGALLLVLLPVPIVHLLTRQQRAKNAELYRVLAIKNDAYCQSLMSNLDSIADIKSFNAQAREHQRLMAQAGAYRRQADAAKQYSSYTRELTQLGVGLGVGASYFYSVVQVIRGALSVDALLVQSALAPMIVATTEGLDFEFNRYQQALAAAKRVQALVAVERHIESGAQRHLGDAVHGEIVFDHVSFCYQAETPLLADIHLRIPAKSTVAFVGATGSGKSTLIKLILRFYDVDQGAIRLDGLDIQAMNIDDLRQAIAIVSQDIHLNQQTIYDNIAYGRPDASYEEVVQAAATAKALHFIQALPQGFETILGDKAQNLSGGERQRIAIARAILKRAPIVIFDEATSSIDSQTEFELQSALTDIERRTTTIIVAHKLLSVRHADTIFVLGQGRVLESGTHDELLALNGSYERLWRLQMLE